MGRYWSPGRKLEDLYYTKRKNKWINKSGS